MPISSEDTPPNSDFFSTDTTVSDPEPTLVTEPTTGSPSSPYRLVRVDWAAATDVGRLRQQNEDDFYVCVQSSGVQAKRFPIDRTDRGLFVVCDGMGGHAGGEIASAMAIEGIAERFHNFWTENLPTADELIQIIHQVNQTIYWRNEKNASQDYGRMGTTLVLMALHNTTVMIAHVGDSRIYRVIQEPKPTCELLTRDHEVGNRLIDQGIAPELAWSRPDAHQLTQAIGPNDQSRVEPGLQILQLDRDSLFLLCSDGLSDNGVIENYWKTHLLRLLSPAYDLQQAVEDVLALGNEVNGHDNLTAILVRCLVEKSLGELETDPKDTNSIGTRG
ncbi:MAG: protein phosphatase 2C domain-containing protein [Pseudanabaenaceae cyanobacterium]